MTERAWIVISISLAACGGGTVTGSQSPPVANQAAEDAVARNVRVYASIGAELEALYCADGGRLATDTCAWPATFTLPLTPPVEMVRREFDREQLDGEVVHVHAYGVPPPVGALAIVLVVESDAGVTAWAAPTRDDVGPDDQQLPIARPTVVVDGSGVERLAQPETIDVPAYEPPVPYAALDLDRDGLAEEVYLATDDGGGYVAVREADDGFSARIQ